jgi:hypothetical protein
MNRITEIPFSMSLAASATGYSDVIDLTTIASSYVFSAQYTVTGTGTVTLTPMCSNDGINYVAGTAIVTAYAAASGTCLPDTFTPPLCKFMKIRAVEAGGAAAAAITGVICIQ